MKRNYSLTTFLFLARTGFLAVIAILMLNACGSNEETKARPVAVASISPVADWVRHVGGDLVDVEVIVPPNASPHTFELQPRILRETARAKLVVLMGKDFESWGNKLLSTIDQDGPKVLLLLEGEHGHTLLEDHHHGHIPHANPHLWLDPLFAADAVQRIGRLLTLQFPEKHDAISSRVEAYRDSLFALHEEINTMAQHWKDKPFVADHSSWVYFARRYGLRQTGVLEEIPGREVSALTMSRLIDHMREQKVTAIFADIRKAQQAVEILSEETGAGIAQLDPLGSERTSYSYIDLMRHNAREIDKVLR